MRYSLIVLVLTVTHSQKVEGIECLEGPLVFSLVLIFYSKHLIRIYE